MSGSTSKKSLSMKIVGEAILNHSCQSRLLQSRAWALARSLLPIRIDEDDVEPFLIPSRSAPSRKALRDTARRSRTRNAPGRGRPACGLAQLGKRPSLVRLEVERRRRRSHCDGRASQRRRDDARAPVSCSGVHCFASAGRTTGRAWPRRRATAAADDSLRPCFSQER